LLYNRLSSFNSSSNAQMRTQRKFLQTSKKRQHPSKLLTKAFTTTYKYYIIVWSEGSQEVKQNIYLDRWCSYPVIFVEWENKDKLWLMRNSKQFISSQTISHCLLCSKTLFCFKCHAVFVLCKCLFRYILNT